MGRGELSPKAWLALFAVYTIWGSTYLGIRVLIETIPPFLGASVRWLVAGSVLYAIGRRSLSPTARPTVRHWRSATLIGAGLILGGNGLVSVAEHRVASGTAALLVATVPIFVALFAWVRTRARQPRPVLMGLVAGFAGTAVLVRPQAGGDTVDLVGAATVLAAAISWALGSLYARAAPLPSSPLLATGMEMLAGGVLLAVAGLAGGEAARLDPAAVSRSSLIALGYLIVFGSFGGFTAYLWLLRNVRTSIATTYAYVNPFVAVMLGRLVLDEPITATTLLGGAIIVGAVAAIVGSGTREPTRARSPAREDLSAQEMPA